MNKCHRFVNANCSFNCPNAAIEAWEDKYDLDAGRELSINRTSCNECQYNDKYCTCEKDCYLYRTEECLYGTR